MLARDHRSGRRWMFGGLAMAILALPAAAAQAAPAPEPLRICASTVDEPYSTSDADGFENKVAIAVAEAMGRKPEFVWNDRPAIYAVRDQLDAENCDVVTGLDHGDPRVLTSEPYYRSGYVFVSRADRHLDIKDWSDPRIASLGHIVTGFHSPAQLMLDKLGKFDQSYLFSLVGFKSPRNQYLEVSPQTMVAEVVAGHADMAAGFQPELARYVKASPVKLRVIPIADDATRGDGQKVAQRFEESFGVRRGDTQLLQALNAGIEKARPRIRRILDAEGIMQLAPGS